MCTMAFANTCCLPTSSQANNAITTEIQKTVAGSTATGNFWGKVVVDGQQVIYRAFTLPNGTISVGTYTVGAP
jgi:hypothetical protein